MIDTERLFDSLNRAREFTASEAARQREEAIRQIAETDRAFSRARRPAAISRLA
jgi:hypothetical protein